MTTEAAAPTLIDPRILKAQSHPIRAEILKISSEGPNSPSRMHKRMKNGSLQVICHHIKVLREVGLIELVQIKERGGRKGHIYARPSDSTSPWRNGWRWTRSSGIR